MICLTLDKLGVEYGKTTVLDGISAKISGEQIVSVIGHNGSGKTTLLKAIAGLIKYRGSVRLEENGQTLSSSQMRYVPQLSSVQSTLTVFEMVLLGLVNNLTWRVTPEIFNKVDSVLHALEINELSHTPVNELSGGQRQRLALGRALIAKPDVLFMDEPFSALDAVLREHLQHFLKQLRERHPCTMVFVTHDIGEAVYLGEYIMLLGARPSRVAAFGANPSFTADAGVDVRGTDAFYAVQRRLHNAVAAVRIGKELHLTDGTW